MKKIILVLLLNLQIFIMGNVFAQSPIGDNTHTEVYTFIQDALIKSKSWPEIEVAKLRKQEIAQQGNKDLKPHIADIYEGELNSLLKILCQVQPNCEEITLYQKDGIGIATSGFKQNIIFKTPRQIDFLVGILSPELKYEPKVYRLQAKNNQKFNEYLYAIYKNEKENYAYLAFKSKQSEDKLIGFVSYIVN